MSARARTRFQTLTAQIKHENVKEREKTEMQGKRSIHSDKPMDGHCSRKERKIALQQDVDKLKKRLRHEENVHRALQRAFTRPAGALPRLPPYLPPQTLQLLAEVAVLEEEVVHLEEQLLNFRQGLYQETVYISSSKKNIENIIDLYDQNPARVLMQDQSKSYSRIVVLESVTARCLPASSDKPSSSNKFSSDSRADGAGHLSNSPTTGKNNLKKLNSRSASREDGLVKENQANADSAKNLKQTSAKASLSSHTSMKRPPVPPRSTESLSSPLHSQLESRLISQESAEDTSSSIPNGVVYEGDSPNRTSEDILKCLLSIFVRLSTPKARMESQMLPSISRSYSCGDSTRMEFKDPYGMCSKFEKGDIGPYKHLHAIEASSIISDRIVNSSFLIQRLRILLGKLAMVDLRGLNRQQKLAFWINIYNSCIMNAYLEHGIPESSEMVVELLRAAQINVSGYLLDVTTIEHFILRLPYSKYTTTKGLKNEEVTMRNIFGLDWPEPLVTFALSCGSWSSPAVRVYTASDVENELEMAKGDYLQAAVSISVTKVALPKLLDWYLLDFAKDIESLLDWICLQLPDKQRKEAIRCLELWKKDANSQSVKVIPYDFRFRYLLAH